MSILKFEIAHYQYTTLSFFEAFILFESHTKSTIAVLIYSTVFTTCDCVYVYNYICMQVHVLD